MKISKVLGALMVAGLILVGSAEAGRYDRVKEIVLENVSVNSVDVRVNLKNNRI